MKPRSNDREVQLENIWLEAMSWFRVTKREMPSLLVKDKGQNIAGEYIGRDNRIVLNSQLEPRAFLDTLYHELAHAIVRWLFTSKVQPHGPEWKLVMKRLGQCPTIYHSYKLAPKARKVALKDQEVPTF